MAHIDRRPAVLVIANAMKMGTAITSIEFEDMTACQAAEENLNEWAAKRSSKPYFACVPTKTRRGHGAEGDDED